MKARGFFFLAAAQTLVHLSSSSKSGEHVLDLHPLSCITQSAKHLRDPGFGARFVNEGDKGRCQ